ncbi:hypothetical protein OIU79_009474 [Salix purpurea]|uniref:BZIP domain-containing protein n=1 Tax=Salix purpurea TaxID=77065 RepID=A0A9Q0TKS0_SALPP|nr:hypothetical protein OIU79_009474 [Salix purpurea]
MSARTDLHSTKEMKNRKKREADRRHRQNKKIAVQETENKLAMTIIENESLKRAVEELRQEIFHRTSQRELTEQRIAVQETENKLAMTIMENESLKRAVEELRQEIFHLTSQRELTEQRFETIYTELEKEIECVCAAAEGFGEQRGMTPGAGNSQQPFHAVNQFSN